MTRVFKYRYASSDTFERDLDALKNDYFWASKRENLNDPFEGLFGRNKLNNQLDIVSKLFKLSVSSSFKNFKSSVDNLLNFVDTVGILSLSTVSMEELLWAHYGNSHQGFCIEYDFDKLIEFEKSNELFNFDILYANSPSHMKLNDFVTSKNPEVILKKMLGIKSKPWSYEKEHRIITTTDGRKYYDFRAVKAIYFGYRMSEDNQDKIMKTLAGRGISYHKIELKELSYKLTSKPIIDPYKDAPRYRYSIGKIADGAIYAEGLEPELKKYADYLYKAAEIVRREPYCDEIQLVDFSISKSTLNNPVIYAEYERDTDKWFRNYLTLSEIDKQFSEIDDL